MYELLVLVAFYVCICLTTCLTFVSICTYQLVVAWILKLARATTQPMVNQEPVSYVAKLQTIGLAAITITEAVLPRGAKSKLTADELGDVAELLSYQGLPLHQIFECQAIVSTNFR